MIPRYASPKQIDLGLAVLRIVAGIVFVAHGYQKFVVMGLEGTTGFFAQSGVPMPGITAALVATLEVVGGIALVLGLMTRLVAALLAVDVLGAIIFVHAKHGFFVPMGIEFVLTLMTAAVTLALAGPGALSVDRMLGGPRRDTGD